MMEKLNRPLRIALFAEAVTLAHVARPIALARAIAPAGHQLLLACDPRYAEFTSDGPWQRENIQSIPSAQFNEALARGKPVYDFDSLSSYVQEDLKLLKAFKPDLVVGDFRLSLSVSARLASVPYLAITNAYWSPAYAEGYPLPVIPLSRALPLPFAEALFNLFRPLAFIPHCQPMNRLRQQHGLPSLGNNLRRVYTDADHLLIPDVPDLYPLAPEPTNSSRIGPLMWSPTIDLPEWWNEPQPVNQPLIYVTLGSSGPTSILPIVLEALAELPVTVFATTAGGNAPPSVPENVRLARYLPGDAAARRATLMICNGGSLSTQQAIAAGTPILAIASNMDQFLNMGPVVKRQAGICMRSDRLTVTSVRQAAAALLHSAEVRSAARGLRELLMRDMHTAQIFHQIVDHLLVNRPGFRGGSDS